MTTLLLMAVIVLVNGVVGSSGPAELFKDPGLLPTCLALRHSASISSKNFPDSVPRQYYLLACLEPRELNLLEGVRVAMHRFRTEWKRPSHGEKTFSVQPGNPYNP